MIIVCPECLAKNRVPEDKLTANPACGQCHQALIPLAPIELNEQNFSHVRIEYVGATDFMAHSFGFEHRQTTACDTPRYKNEAMRLNVML